MKNTSIFIIAIYFSIVHCYTQNENFELLDSFESLTGLTLYQVLENYQQKNYKSIEKIMDGITYKIEKTNNYQLKGDLLFLKAFIAMKKGDKTYKKALNNYEEFAKVKLINHPYKAKLSILKAYKTYFKGKWSESLHHFDRSLILSVSEKDQIIETISKLYKAYIFSFTIDKAKGLNNLKTLYRELELKETTKENQKNVLIYTSRTLELILRHYILYESKNTDSIVKYNTIYSSKIKSLNDTLLFPRMFLLNAYTKARLDDKKSSEYYLNKAKHNQQNYFNHFILINTYFHQDEFYKTIFTTEAHKALQNIDKEDYPWLSPEFLLLAKTYEKIGDFKNSSFYYNHHNKATEQLQSLLDSVSQVIRENERKNYNDQLQKLNIEKNDTSYKVDYLNIIVILLVGSLCITFIYFYNYKKTKERIHVISLHNLLKIQSKSEKKKQTTVKPEIVKHIIEALKELEKDKFFLNVNCNAYTTAKQIHTNTTYLSKAINSHYNKSFNEYINTLRITYVLDKLDHDKRYKSYSIESIANELGYKSSDSFRKAFKKHTGNLPSNYINTKT
ncbi:helix-turn-helix domain-containing protein [Tenacibaculum jejuense]|uniref:HTH araC/xylS-type domain-containing protein n=1 Tax=Tenacibaculum jejuense TaxID=584609 RepID=A0A238U8V6_9FLAO|nr:helix-turn-helix domain-containing protein [Tenacibaculum jejuense]SNR15426.1 protein of unknown function [Tenacibaculum jejuense]